MTATTTAHAPRHAAGPEAEPRFDLRSLLTIARKEARDALRNKWFLLYAVSFAGLALGMAYLALAGTGSYGLAGFGKTAASLVNLVLLIVPLMGLTTGAGCVAGERERRTLDLLLTQPVGRTTILLGKYLGSALALLLAISLGFGVSAAAMALQGGMVNAGRYAGLFGFSSLLACAMLSVGFFVSVLSRRTAVAQAAAIFIWLLLVFFTDLALMGGTVALRLQAGELFMLASINPLQEFKLGAIGQLHASLDLLGPAGLYATRRLGDALPAVFAAMLAAWTVVPLLLSILVFARKES